MIVAPSILSADFNNLESEVKKVLDAGADWIHVDVMDGHFVPNITMGPVIIKNLRKKFPDIFLDVHLMIENPERYIEDFVKAGASHIGVHKETCVHIDRVLSYIRSFGIMAGITYNPGTPLCGLEYIREKVDVVLIMSVNPGFSGQSFIPEMTEKIKLARNIMGNDKIIQVDGGVCNTNIELLRKSGANSVVSGSYIFDAPDFSERIRVLKGE
jgi:ribulose-phosphate 3-epimerase